jgi:hypothetical protein
MTSDGSGSPTGASDAQYRARIERTTFVPTPADDLIALVRDVWLNFHYKRAEVHALEDMTDAARLSWWHQQTSPTLKRLMVLASACKYKGLANELCDLLTAE